MTLASLASRTGVARCPNTRILSVNNIARIPTQSRTIWQSHRHSRGKRNCNGIGWIRAERRIRQRVTNPTPHQKRPHEETPEPWWGWGSGSRSGWNAFDNAGTKDFFETERLRAKQRMEEIKREINKDPYAALFGRRLDPVNLWGKHEDTLADMCRSFFGLDKSDGSIARTKRAGADATPRVKPEGKSGVDSTQARDAPKHTHVAPVFEASQSQCFVDTRASDFEFDPISGRMVPKKPAAADTTGTSAPFEEDSKLNVPDNNSNVGDGHLGILSPTKSSIDSTALTPGPDIGGVQHREPEQRTDEVAQSGDKGVLDVNFNDISSAPPTHEAPSSIAKGTAVDGVTIGTTSAVSEPKNEDVSLQQSYAKDSNMVDMQQSESLTPDAQPNEGRKMKGFFYVDKKEPEYLKIQDSPQQSEPFLVLEKEELDLLRASDIRASYPSKELENKSDAENGKLDGPLDEVTPNQDSVNTIYARAIETKPEPQNASSSVDERSVEPTNYTEMSQSSLRDPEAPQSTGPQVRNEDTEFTEILDQAPKARFTTLNESTSSAMYRVLAYDPSTMQVTTAETGTSFVPSNKILRPSDVLPRLNSPAKFLPYFEEMQKEGYEIVSGGSDILVFKRFADVEKKSSDKSSLETKEHGNMTEDATLEQHQEQAALTSTSSPQLSQEPSTGSSKTGKDTPPRKQRSAFNNAIRRMLFTGTAAAGTCYAFGVVTEYFRTGGSDGRGVDAFTVFESERRQRD